MPTDIELIAGVHRFPCLWDKSCPGSRYFTKRSECWSLLSNELNERSVTLRERWSALRRKYAREKVKLSAIREPGVRRRSMFAEVWPLLDYLQFLDWNDMDAGAKTEKSEEDITEPEPSLIDSPLVEQSSRGSLRRASLPAIRSTTGGLEPEHNYSRRAIEPELVVEGDINIDADFASEWSAETQAAAEQPLPDDAAPIDNQPVDPSTLIACVEKLPLLWNRSVPGYGDADRTAACWSQMADWFNTTAQHIQSMWHVIVEQNRLARLEPPSDHPWDLLDRLNFLPNDPDPEPEPLQPDAESSTIHNGNSKAKRRSSSGTALQKQQQQKPDVIAPKKTRMSRKKSVAAPSPVNTATAMPSPIPSTDLIEATTSVNGSNANNASVQPPLPPPPPAYQHWPPLHFEHFTRHLAVEMETLPRDRARALVAKFSALLNDELLLNGHP